MKTVAIIQARMGSSRLPGKVLMPFAGKPVLWHIIHRLHKCKTLDAIALATTIHPIDDPLVQFAKNEGIAAIRGSEDNVLERYYLAAKTMQADIIVRVTGDAPLIDPDFLDYLVSMLLEKKVDWVVGDPEIPCIHEGFAPFTFNSLAKLIKEASDDPIAREHVDAYFKIHPDFIPGAYIRPAPEYQFRGARMSVDTPADLRFLETIYRRLKTAPGEADIRDVVALLKKEPELLTINAHIHQKKVNETTRRILFFCDRNEKNTVAPYKRFIELAELLRDRYGYGISFITPLESKWNSIVRQAGFPIEMATPNEKEVNFEEIIFRFLPDIIILDKGSNFELEVIYQFKDRKIVSRKEFSKNKTNNEQIGNYIQDILLKDHI